MTSALSKTQIHIILNPDMNTLAIPKQTCTTKTNQISNGKFTKYLFKGSDQKKYISVTM